MLDDFLALETASEDHLLAFATRWGVLGLCGCGIPASHNPPRPVIRTGPVDADAALPWCEQVSERRHGRDVFAEPVRAWRDLAGTFRALVNVASELVEDRPGAVEDWKRVWRPRPEGLGPDDSAWRLIRHKVGRDVQGDKVRLENAVTELLRMADLRPRFMWRRHKPTFEVVPGSLFAALVVELCSAISSTRGLTQCSGCGRFVDDIPPSRPGQRRYCSTCRRTRQPQRDAERDYRRRQRDKPKKGATK
jgi:hypothetical protein